MSGREEASPALDDTGSVFDKQPAHRKKNKGCPYIPRHQHPAIGKVNISKGFVESVDHEEDGQQQEEERVSLQ